MNRLFHVSTSGRQTSMVPLLARALGTLCILAVEPMEGQAPSRQWLAEPILEYAIEDEDGSLLGDVRSIKGSPGGGFVIADWGDFAIQAFSSSGEPLWRAGREGRGPGEFLQIMHMEYDGDELVVLDNKNRRLTAISETGQVTSSRPLPEGEMNSVLPTFRAGERTLRPHTGGRDTLWESVSDAGTVNLAVPMPSAISFEHDLVGSSYTSRAGAGAVVAFRWSSQLILVNDDGQVGNVVDGVERIAFPGVKTQEMDPGIEGVVKMVSTRVDPRATEAAASVTASGRRIFVLFRGRTENAGRIVDTYGASRGEYRGSILLPSKVADIAILEDGRLATLETDLFPVIRVWTIVDARDFGDRVLG